MARRRLSRIRDTSRKVISSQAGRKRLEGSWVRGRKIRVRDTGTFDQSGGGSMEIDTADARLVTLPRCPECLFSVVLYAPIKLHAQRVLASNVIGTLVTGGEEKKYRREKKRQREGKKKRESCPGEKIRRFALSIRLFHKSESDLPSSFFSHSILNIPFGSVNRDIFIAAIRHSGNILLCMY